MQTILVTGCAGFIGSHVCERLLRRQYQVVGVDNFDPFYPKETKLRNLSAFVNNPHFRFLELDLTQPSALNRVSGPIDLVVHLAGKAGVRPSIADPAAYIHHNILATHAVLDFMKSQSVSRLIFASSSSVYGNTAVAPFSEDQNVDHPISPYAFSKKACELLTHTYHHLYQMAILTLRFFTVYGPRQRPDLTIHQFVDRMLKGERITMFGDGLSSRDYTYIDDTLSGIEGALAYIQAHPACYEIVNLGNNKPVTLRDLIRAIEQRVGRQALVETRPMQPGDVETTCASIEKARRLLNYQPATSLRDGLDAFVRWKTGVS